MGFKLPLIFRLKYLLESRLRTQLRMARGGSDNDISAGEHCVLDSRWHGILRYLFEAGIIEIPRLIRYGGEALDALDLFSFFIPTKPLGPFTDGHEHGFFYNQGAAFFDRHDAVSRTIGELLERFALAVYHNKDLIKASSFDLEKGGRPFLEPGRISQFSEDQRKTNPRLSFHHKTVFQWVMSRSLVSRKSLLIPAQAVFWNYCDHFLKEPRLLEPNTNGAAGMFLFAEAILSALYELIQRDALLIFWLNKISPPRIDVSTIKDKHILKVINDLGAQGFDIALYDLTSDIRVPVCLAALSDPSGYPRVNIGAGCDGSAESAVKSALAEAVIGNYYVKYKRQRQPSLTGQMLLQMCFVDGSGKEARMLFWAEPENFQHCAFLFRGRGESYDDFSSRSLRFASKKRELAHLLDIFRAKGEGYEPYYYEARHPVLKDVGYRVVRVIVPKLVPLYLSENYIPLSAGRLAETPPLLGLEPADALNKWPHPFP